MICLRRLCRNVIRDTLIKAKRIKISPVSMPV